MRKKRLTAALSAALGIAAQPTLAENVGFDEVRNTFHEIGVGHIEYLEFVLELPDGADQALGPDVSLCHLVRKYHFSLLPVLYWSEGYVLATDRCNTNQFHSLTADQFKAMQTLGLLPADFPEQPSLRWQHRLPLIGEAFLVGLIFLSVRRADRRQKARFAQMGDLAEPTKRLLDALCHAAQVSRQTDPLSRDVITTIIAKTTGDALPTDVVDRALADCPAKPKLADYSRFAKGLSMDQRQVMYRLVVIFLLRPTGFLSSEAKVFLYRLAAGCRLQKEQVAAVYRELADSA